MNFFSFWLGAKDYIRNKNYDFLGIFGKKYWEKQVQLFVLLRKNGETFFFQWCEICENQQNHGNFDKENSNTGENSKETFDTVQKETVTFICQKRRRVTWYRCKHDCPKEQDLVQQRTFLWTYFIAQPWYNSITPKVTPKLGQIVVFVFMKNIKRRNFCRKSFFKRLQNYWTGRGRQCSNCSKSFFSKRK